MLAESRKRIRSVTLAALLSLWHEVNVYLVFGMHFYPELERLVKTLLSSSLGRGLLVLGHFRDVGEPLNDGLLSLYGGQALVQGESNRSMPCSM